MTRITMSVAAAALAALLSTNAWAVDILNSDDAAHQLTLTLKDGTVLGAEIVPQGELRPICEDGGCKITMADGQFFDAKKEDIVLIIKGEISVYEP